MPVDPRALVINVDGSALTNPGIEVGCAGVVSFPNGDENVELQWSYGYGTSGSMEVAALVNAIKWINENASELKNLGINKVVIISDNTTVVSGASNWVYNWYKNRWRKNDGSPVRNIPLWKDYLRERSKCRISFEVIWGKGKSDSAKKRVDRLAKEAAKTPTSHKTRGTNLPSVGRSLTGKENLQLSNFDREQSDILARVFYHTYIDGSKECEVRFEHVNSDSGTVIGKYRAFAARDIDALLDRGNLYKLKISTTAGHAKIVSAKRLSVREQLRLRNLFVKNGYLKE